MSLGQESIEITNACQIDRRECAKGPAGYYRYALYPHSDSEFFHQFLQLLCKIGQTVGTHLRLVAKLL